MTRNYGCGDGDGCAPGIGLTSVAAAGMAMATGADIAKRASFKTAGLSGACPCGIRQNAITANLRERKTTNSEVEKTTGHVV